MPFLKRVEAATEDPHFLSVRGYEKFSHTQKWDRMRGGSVVERAEDDVNESSYQSSTDGSERAKGQSMETVLDLPAYNDLSNVGDVRESILGAIADIDRLVIDGEKVERMDTPTVQMLVAARRSFALENIEVVFRMPSESMVKSFTDLGLKTEIEAWGI